MASPRLAGRAGAFRESVFATLARKMKTLEGPVAPLHIGDTWLSPPAEAHLARLDEAQHPRLYDYAHPGGLPELGEALAELAREARGLDTTAEGIQVTCGATQGLLSASLALLEPGDRVLVLAPYWPLITGVLRCAGAEPLDVPFYDRLSDDDPAGSAAAIVEPHLREGVRAIYLNTPNNPTGRVLRRETLAAVVDLAREHDLWILSDEAYADYVYGDRNEHVAAASLPGAAERTVTVYTFSKSHAMAGNRVGWVAAPPEVAAAVRRISTHNTYCAPMGSQLSALSALRHGAAWQQEARRTYAEAAARVSERLALPHRPAEGGSFVFLDLREVVAAHGEDVVALLSRCLDHGVALSPGAAFGADYAGWARLCFTAAPPDDVVGAAERVNAALEAPRGC